MNIPCCNVCNITINFPCTLLCQSSDPKTKNGKSRKSRKQEIVSSEGEKMSTSTTPLESFPDISKEISQILDEKNSGVGKEDSKFKSFETRYPQLFEMLYSPSLNMKELDFIIKKYESVRKGEMSYADTSKQVGQAFYDNYVAPVLPNQK